MEKDNNSRKILIIEDSGPDRIRFRKIIDKIRQRPAYSGKIDYEFAWSAKEKSVWEIEKIQKKAKQYDYLFLDLAWSKDEEDVMNKAKRQSLDWLIDNAEQWTGEAKGTMKEIRNLKGEGLVKNICGFDLLDVLSKDNGRPNIPIVVTTGFYSPPVAKFCEKKWKVGCFMKWEDEDNIEAFIVTIFNDKGE